jgi:ABC-type antimicrobial peptide transport system permease subunit
MSTNYLRTAWRRLLKNKGFFALNFVGLYISVTASLLIALLIIHETSFDKSSRSDVQIYRVVNNFQDEHGANFNAVTPYPLARALRIAMPDVKDIAQIHFERDGSVLVGQDVFKETSIVFADSVFPRLFPLHLLKGSLARAFREPGFTVLTASEAQRLFGPADPIGKRIKLDAQADLEVVAVVADAAPNSHLPFHMLVSYPSLTKDLIGGFPLDTWTLNANGYVYVALPNVSMVAGTERILADLVKKNITAGNPTEKDHFILQPLSDIHFDMDYASSNPGYTTNSSYLELIGAIGLFLILAACINYTNLSTAMALKKSKEVGVRKTLGATRPELMRQLLSETFLLTAIVIGAAAGTVGLFLPMLNAFLDKNIPTQWLGFASGSFLVILWVLVALVSGIYPALVLSGFKPVIALKSTVTTPRGGVLLLRRGLVVFQFVTAQVLIICAIVVSKQMDYIRSKPLGFNKDMVIDVGLPNSMAEERRAFRARLENISGISAISFSVGAPVSQNAVGTGFNRREDFKRRQIDIAAKLADKDYLKTYGLQLVAGRWIDDADEQSVEDQVPDSLKKYVFVLNETAVKALGYRSPEEAIGKQITFGFNGITAPVIGVVKDYHLASMHQAIMPVLMAPFSFFYYNAGIKLSGGNLPATMDAIEKAFKAAYPQHLYVSQFLDEAVAAQYQEEKRTLELFDLFTGLSIAINVLGLIGLLAFMIEQKTKEVGIRKVLGASVHDISFLLSRDFLKMIGIAFLLAAPVAGLLMDRWLRAFPYRTGLSWWVFAGALLCTIVVTAVAVSFQTLRAAVASPVRALRSE